MSNFDVLYESELERFQCGGVIVGDRVRFRKECMNLDYIKNRGQSYRDIIAACMQQEFDLNLRVGAIKSIYPTTTQNYRGGSEAPDGVFLDIYIEYAPGLYRNPMTVPIEAIETIDDGINRGPVPDSLRRKNNIQIKPEQQEAKPSTDLKVIINLPDQNTVLPHSNKWNDKKPGGGNF
tara:strand:- start:1429 stop:1962 length:534 start_codon:yes stop_codon:yes gene_type:complete